MLTKINSAKQLQSEIAVRQEQLSQFTTPTMFDTDLLPAIYKAICDSDDAPKEVRHCFVFIAVYLYSPSALLGQYSIKAGLCQKIGDTIGCCRQVVSETFSQALLRYNKLPTFAQQVDKIYRDIIEK